MDIHAAEILESQCRHLPAKVQDKVLRLIDESQAAWAGLNFANENQREAWRVFKLTESDNARNYNFTYTSDADGRPVYDCKDQRWREDYAPRLVAMWESWKRAGVNIPYLKGRWEAYASLQDLTPWLAKNTHFTKHAPVKVKAGEHGANVEKLRAQIADIDGKISDAEYAPCSVDDLVARAENEIDRIAERGEIRLDPRIREGSPMDIGWPVAALTQPDTVIQAEKLVWVFADEIKKKLAAKIRAEAPKSGVLSDFDRAAELSALEAEKLDAERLEEAHISAAAELGQFIPRRREANPLAVLEIE